MDGFVDSRRAFSGYTEDLAVGEEFFLMVRCRFDDDFEVDLLAACWIVDCGLRVCKRSNMIKAGLWPWGCKIEEVVQPR
jgi:hypothetical protein